MLSIRKVNSVLGAEIMGIDLSKGIDKPTIQKINELWLEHEVIFFRNQQLSPEQHIAFSEQLGEVEVHVRTDCCKPGYPKLFVVSNIVKNGKLIGAGDAGTNWHSDGCCVEKPSRGSILYAKVIPEVNGIALGDTMFSSMTKAYEALPDDMKVQLNNMRAVNSYVKGYYRPIRVGKRPELTEQQKNKVPDLDIPIVRLHPLTRKPCLFINETFTSKIVGMSETESKEILDYLFKHTTTPSFVYRHKWQKGDLLLWDNCSTLHCAIADYLPLPRLMERTTIVGTERVTALAACRT